MSDQRIEWKATGCDPAGKTMLYVYGIWITNDTGQPVINGYDLGDLLSEIDDQIGQAIERTAHRYVPRPIAQDLRKRIVKQVADYAINHSRQLET